MQATPKMAVKNAVADLEHVGVAAEQGGADYAEGEAHQHDRAHEVDLPLAHELDQDPQQTDTDPAMMRPWASVLTCLRTPK